MSSRDGQRAKGRGVHEIEADLSRTRSRIDATLGALGRKLSPARLTGEVVEKVKNASAAAGIGAGLLLPATRAQTSRDRGDVSAAREVRVRRKKKGKSRIAAVLTDAALAAAKAAMTPSRAVEPISMPARESKRAPTGRKTKKKTAGASRSRKQTPKSRSRAR